MRYFKKIDRFRIRKTLKWKIFAYPLLQDWQLLFTFFTPILIYISFSFFLMILFIAMYEDCGHILLDMTPNSDIIIRCVAIIGFIIWLFVFICLIKSPLHNYENSIDVEHLKHEWWIIKKINVAWIKIYSYNVGHWWWRFWQWYRSYYLEATDWTMIYCSDSYTWGVVWFIESFKKLDHTFWSEYIDDDIYKQSILHDYDQEIAKKQHNRGGGFSKLWHTPSCREVNWHRISVWDTVTVYIDPENPERYRMDTDFLFEK